LDRNASKRKGHQRHSADGLVSLSHCRSVVPASDLHCEGLLRRVVFAGDKVHTDNMNKQNRLFDRKDADGKGRTRRIRTIVRIRVLRGLGSLVTAVLITLLLTGCVYRSVSCGNGKELASVPRISEAAVSSLRAKSPERLDKNSIT